MIAHDDHGFMKKLSGMICSVSTELSRSPTLFSQLLDGHHLLQNPPVLRAILGVLLFVLKCVNLVKDITSAHNNFTFEDQTFTKFQLTK